MEDVILLQSRPFSPVPSDEPARQQEVERLPLGAGWPPELEQLAAAAAAVAGTSSGVVTIIDGDWQLMAATHRYEPRIMGRPDTICAHAIMQPQEVLCVADLQADRRFARLPITNGTDALRFYAGAPILVGSQPVGMLCAIDTEGRELPDNKQRRALRRLARVAATLLQGKPRTR